MNRRIGWMLAACVLPALAGGARGALVSQTWGDKGKITHPGTLKVVTTGKVPRLIFDLPAIPKGAKVASASLRVQAAQPREPIRILLTDRVGDDGKPVTAGEPLALEPPYFRSFDATAAVQRWVNDPSKNLGLALESFAGAAGQSILVVRYDGKPSKAPAQVEGLRAVHRNGQTFLVWKELPAYRPPDKSIIWITRVAGYRSEVTDKPGLGVEGYPSIPAIRLQTLRDLQGLAVRDKPIGQWARAMPPFKRLREVPDVSYRVWRHSQRITAANIAEARLLGEVDALTAYQDGFIHIKSHGEYYAPHEDAASVIPTWSMGKGDPVLPGQTYFVHTPGAEGKAFYAVTAVQDGTEDAAEFSDANATGAVAETVEAPQPVLQFVTVNPTRYGNSSAVEYWHGFWLAPPLANVPGNTPRRVVMAIPKDFKDPGPMVLSTHAGMGPGWKVDHIDKAYLHIEQDVAYAGDLCYHSGRGTLKSFREGRVDYYSDRYVTNTVMWALKTWKIDRSRITSSVGTHYGIRHGDLLPILWNAPYSIDYNQKWNPAMGSLAGRLGPADIAQTVDGHKAWDVFDIAWYLRQDPGKDIPYWVHDVNGKETGHNVEYGWQDDAKGLRALQDTRQPHVAHWGGHISRDIIDGLRKMSWTRSVPAFTGCSLDANPGNGDPADGDPWGQINGYLFWEFDSIVDEADRWEMTVYLTADCTDKACTVDLTPRHCRKFKPKAGQAFTWTNTSVADKKALGNGTIQADKWGLVTLKNLTVTQGRNRIVIKVK